VPTLHQHSRRYANLLLFDCNYDSILAQRLNYDSILAQRLTHAFVAVAIDAFPNTSCSIIYTTNVNAYLFTHFFNFSSFGRNITL